jgi:hypothetical protein
VASRLKSAADGEVRLLAAPVGILMSSKLRDSASLDGFSSRRTRGPVHL